LTVSDNNLDIKKGYLTKDAELWETRSGQPKVVFRLKVPFVNVEGKARGAHFFSVVSYGHKFLSLYPLLVENTQVMVVGHTQSRDLPDGKRVVVETVAHDIFVIDSPERMEVDANSGAKTGN